MGFNSAFKGLITLMTAHLVTRQYSYVLKRDWPHITGELADIRLCRKQF